jgi:hypothetical protein
VESAENRAWSGGIQHATITATLAAGVDRGSFKAFVLNSLGNKMNRSILLAAALAVALGACSKKEEPAPAPPAAAPAPTAAEAAKESAQKAKESAAAAGTAASAAVGEAKDAAAAAVEKAKEASAPAEKK